MTAKLTYNSLPPEIKAIANESLGAGVLKSMFGSYAHTYHMVIKISNGEFVGFGLYHFKNVRIPGKGTKTVGVIDCVCVSTPYRKDGFGTLITFSVLRNIASYGASRVELILKTPRVEDRDGEPGIPLIGNQQVLQTLGFRRVKIQDGYFAENSKRWGYECRFCGNWPDTCKGITYVIDDDSSE